MSAAIVYDRYGPPEVLSLQDVARPKPEPHQVLIRVRAAGVNPIDWKIRSGALKYVLPIHPPLVPGYDVAGTVAAVGGEVHSNNPALGPGDEVFCFLDSFSGGGYAEYVTASASVLAPKPTNVSYAEAASVPLAGITALQGLRDHGRLVEGEDVLINGAAGGVGSLAVQIAKALGAHVTGVCGPDNLEFVRSLGADELVNYHQEDFTRSSRRFDLVFDAVGKSSYFRCRRVLGSGGRYLSTLPGPKVWLARLVSWFGGRTAKSMIARPSGDDLRFLGQLIENQRLRPYVEAIFPLAQAADAHRASEAGHVRGKLVLSLEDQL